MATVVDCAVYVCAEPGCGFITTTAAGAIKHPHPTAREYRAGLRSVVKARETGTYVGVYSGLESGIDSDEDNPWVTVCEEHDNLLSHPTLALAKAWASSPTTWCQDCQD
jgi:hypothetical protein